MTVNSGGVLSPGIAAAGNLAVGGSTIINDGGKLAIGAAAGGTSNGVTVDVSSATFDFKNGSILDLSLLSGFTNTAAASYTILSMPTGSGGNLFLNGAATAKNSGSSSRAPVKSDPGQSPSTRPGSL